MKKIWTALQHLLGRSDIYMNGSLYMKRWRFLPERWPGVRLHCIVRSDADRELHDHPFDFLSILLWGGYYEYTSDGLRTWCRPFTVRYRKAEALHRVELYPPGGRHPEFMRHAWTLVFRGRYRREWGFQTKQGWLPWRAFLATKELGIQDDWAFVAPTST